MLVTTTIGIIGGLVGLVIGLVLGVKMTERDVVTCPCPACRQHHAVTELADLHERFERFGDDGAGAGATLRRAAAR